MGNNIKPGQWNRVVPDGGTTDMDIEMEFLSPSGELRLLITDDEDGYSIRYLEGRNARLGKDDRRYGTKENLSNAKESLKLFLDKKANEPRFSKK